ncbi:MAG: nucleotidyltransferase domain-containing protein [Acholeplasmatales bacterium]|nr:nucleotidyltransferase domain-containing protein [Acholeplasmatales bacterium]
MSNVELIVRKTVSQFIEKMFRYNGYVFNHDEYKKVVYNEREPLNNEEIKIKRYYDAYMYLLNNSKSVLDRRITNTFYYVLKEEIIDEQLNNKIINSYFYLSEYPPLEKAILFHQEIKELLVNYDNLDKMIIPLMFLNYVLVKYDIPSFKLSMVNINKYESLYGKNELALFISELIEYDEAYTKEYFDNLKDISIKDIYNIIKQDEEMLKTKYFVKNIILYGSYAKGLNRHDSDIDLLVKLDEDLLYNDRLNIVKELKDYYTNIFNRFVDIREIGQYLSDEFLNETKDIKIIF